MTYDHWSAPLMLEQNILGTIMYDPTLIHDAKAWITEEMFVSARHRTLYRWVTELHGEGVTPDIVNLVTKYEHHLDEIGGFEYLVGLAGSIASTVLFEEYVAQFTQGYARRKLLQLFDTYRPLFEDPANGEFPVLLDQFERETLAVRPKRKRDSGVKDVIEWFEQLAERRAKPDSAFGLLTGWPGLDRLTLGFQRCDFFVVGARTSMGKSAFALEIAARIMLRGYRVAVFSLEMSKKQVYNRVSSSLAAISMQAVRTGNLTDPQLDAISGKLDLMAKIHIDDERGITAEYITSEMRRLKRQGGLDMVIIDYLQEIEEPSQKNDNSATPLHRVCQKIRSAAKDCDCSVIGISQVKREVEQRANKRPLPSDLSGSAAIEAVADGIIMLYRDEYYNPDTPAKGIIEIDLAKQRNGPTGLIRLKYDKDLQRIT